MARPDLDRALTVAQLLRHRPAAAVVFVRCGMACPGCAMAPFETLAEAATVYGQEPEGFLADLRRATTATPQDGSSAVDAQTRPRQTRPRRRKPPMTRNLTTTKILLALALATGTLAARPAAAHCDTLDGPVVVDARAALAKGEVTPVLKWVRPAAEPEIRAAFARALSVRTLSPAAAELADTYFFETLVRVHRAGEGAPYTGLKPAGEVEPGIAAADRALETGSADALVKAMSAHVAEGVAERYARVAAAKAHANHTVEAGREYVEAYVDFIHYVERVHAAAVGPATAHGDAVAAPHAH